MALKQVTIVISEEQTKNNALPEVINPAKKPNIFRRLKNYISGNSLDSVEKDILSNNDTYTPEQKDSLHCFRWLLVLACALDSFAHGANDTGNATGPFSAVMLAYEMKDGGCGKPATPVWVMAIAGAFMFVGINTYGSRVIRTIGRDLTNINFLKGFAIELSTTAAVIVASLLHIPVSTTHCQVGSVLAVGWVSAGAGKVNWLMALLIFAAWILTVPGVALIAALFSYLLHFAIL